MMTMTIRQVVLPISPRPLLPRPGITPIIQRIADGDGDGGCQSDDDYGNNQPDFGYDS